MRRTVPPWRRRWGFPPRPRLIPRSSAQEWLGLVVVAALFTVLLILLEGNFGIISKSGRFPIPQSTPRSRLPDQQLVELREVQWRSFDRFAPVRE